MTHKTDAALYVGTYAKYNNGSIYGKWVKLSDYSDAEGFLEYCRELHSDEEDPEFMFQDFEGFPSSFYSESMSCDELEKLLEYVNMNEDDRELLELYADATGYNITEVNLRDAQDAHHGSADSEADFAERMAEECGDIPRDLPRWIVIDWEASWNCNLCYDYNTATDVHGNIHFFLNH
jgi:antirestriction protein